MRIASPHSDSFGYELIQPLDYDNIYQEFLERHGKDVHHIGVRVSNLNEASEHMHSMGYQVIQTGRGFCARGEGAYAHFDTERNIGTIIELQEIPAERVTDEWVYQHRK